MPQPGELWSGDQLFRTLLSMEEIVERVCGVRLVEGQSMRSVSDNLLDLVSAFQREGPHPSADLRAQARQAMGIFDLAAKTNEVANHRDFPNLCAHFRLVLRESALVQSVSSGVLDQTADKMFELLVGLTVMQIGTDVVLDDPEHSRGDNPDVIATVRGRRWGFACKVLHSSNVKTYADTVKKGLEQIRDSEAETGLVLVSLKEHVAYNSFWKKDASGDRAWASVEQADRALERSVEDVLHGWEDGFGGAEQVASLFREVGGVPVVMNYAMPTLLIDLPTGPILTILRRFLPLYLGLPIDQEAANIVDLLDRAVQRPFAPGNLVLVR